MDSGCNFSSLQQLQLGKEFFSANIGWLLFRVLWKIGTAGWSHLIERTLLFETLTHPPEMAHVGTIASSSSPCGPSPAGSSRQLTSNRKKIGGVLRNLSPRRGAQSPVADDDDLFPEDRIRIGRVDKTLEERRDYSSQMSIQQLAKVKAFETNANAKARRKKLKWYIIDPQSTFMQLWDALTAIALIFTALVTPLEVGFLPAPECPSETLFIVNRLVDSIFIFDMTLQFFLSHPVKMNVWEVSLKKIAKRYLEGWFILDIFSIFPSIFDIIPVLECGNTTDPSKKDPATALRVVRALRLLKLLRLMKTPFALVRRLIVRIATPRATVTVLSLLFECLCVSHRMCTFRSVPPHLISLRDLLNWPLFCLPVETASTSSSTTTTSSSSSTTTTSSTSRAFVSP